MIATPEVRLEHHQHDGHRRDRDRRADRPDPRPGLGLAQLAEEDGGDQDDGRSWRTRTARSGSPPATAIQELDPLTRAPSGLSTASSPRKDTP